MASLTELAAQISTYAKTIEETLTEKDLPQPSFAANGPAGLPSGPEFRDLQRTRLALIDAARSIEHLTTGPEAWIKSQTMTLIYDGIALSVLAHFDVFSAVPLEGDISYADIASKVNIPENRLRRFIRQAMSNHIFIEPRPGYVAHTATSAIPVKIPSLKSFVGHNTEDGGPASVKVIEALERWGASDQPAESGFGIAWGLDVKDGKDCVFRFVADDGEGEKKGFRMKRIGHAMESMKGDGAYDVGHVQQGFDWASLGEATVVDLGGSVGHLSIEIASQNPNITCVVQDFPDLQPQFEAILPASLKSRVSFQGHNIFSPQPVKHADVYIFRLVFHDWSDPYCVQMIKQVLPVMKSGSRILAIDAIVPEWKDVQSLTADRLVTSSDLHMMAMMNAKERREADWEVLFREASPELKIKGFRKVEGSALGFVEVVKQ